MLQTGQTQYIKKNVRDKKNALRHQLKVHGAFKSVVATVLSLALPLIISRIVFMNGPVNQAICLSYEQGPASIGGTLEKAQATSQRGADGTAG